jgi:DNA-binding response OmpR family regulator
MKEESDLPAKLNAHSPADLAVLKGVSVLVVEDSVNVVKALRNLLEQLQMVVVGPTATKSEAIQLASERSPRLAIVDFSLKDGNAGDLIDLLHSRGVHLIVMSGYSLPPLKVGVFLQKPFNGGELIQALCAVVAPS